MLAFVQALLPYAGTAMKAIGGLLAIMMGYKIADRGIEAGGEALFGFKEKELLEFEKRLKLQAKYAQAGEESKRELGSLLRKREGMRQEAHFPEALARASAKTELSQQIADMYAPFSDVAQEAPQGGGGAQGRGKGFLVANEGVALEIEKAQNLGRAMREAEEQQAQRGGAQAALRANTPTSLGGF